MNDTNSIRSLKISIIGLGLMGGSLALGLNDYRETLTGFDSDPNVRESAVERKAVGRVAEDLRDAVAQADVIILATPVCAILAILAALPSLHPGNPIVLDLGSSKTEIVEAMERLPSRFDPIGGHPICGKETLSFKHADGNLFRNTVFSFTALPRTSEKARAFARRLTAVLGAKTLWVDPENHDRTLALTSHIPYLIASALALAAPAGAAPLAGSGFQGMTRLAATPAAMMNDVLRTNQSNITQALTEFQDQLSKLTGLLQTGNFTGLEEMLNSSAAHLSDFFREGDR